MHRSIKATVVGLALGVAVFATGCGGDEPAELKQQLINDLAWNDATADCVVKGLQDHGVDLSRYGEPSAEDHVKINEVTTDCVLEHLDLDEVPTTPAP